MARFLVLVRKAELFLCIPENTQNQSIFRQFEQWFTEEIRFCWNQILPMEFSYSISNWNFQNKGKKQSNVEREKAILLHQKERNREISPLPRCRSEFRKNDFIKMRQCFGKEEMKDRGTSMFSVHRNNFQLTAHAASLSVQDEVGKTMKSERKLFLFFAFGSVYSAVREFRDIALRIYLYFASLRLFLRFAFSRCCFITNFA